ncbi:MAG: twin-arginine translocase subunit TatC [Candidatus Obscuribacter sp.]|nr:twin-arginine translocase subunit TatC [Candidatus Obscuribacter sp.]
MQSGETKEEKKELALAHSEEEELGLTHLSHDEDLTDPVSVDDEEESLAAMSVVEHLDELRWRIMRSVGYVAIAFVSALFFTKNILKFLEAPAGDISFQALSIEEPLLVFFKVAFYVGLISALLLSSLRLLALWHQV